VKITKLKLQRFLGFEDFTVEFKDFTVLVGPNSGGKTSILRAINFVFDALRVYYGNQEQPNVGMAGSIEARTGLSPAFTPLMLPDPQSLYYGRGGTSGAQLVLDAILPDGNGNVRLHVQIERNYQGRVLGSLNDQPFNILQPPIVEGVLRRLYFSPVEFRQSLSTISPTESVLAWPQVMSNLNEGRFSDIVRNWLHWLLDGPSQQAFETIAARIEQYLPGVRLHPPQRSRDNQPRVIVTYAEDGFDHDLSVSGNGLKTILVLLAAMQASRSPVLLFDEPDAHLHSSVQRAVAGLMADEAGFGHQIIITSHAPDLIEEAPVDSLVWIDRHLQEGRSCDDAGRVLVDLGAVSKTQAVRTLGADTLLLFEDKPDSRVLGAVLRRVGKADLFARCRVGHLHGYGDVAHLPHAIRVSRQWLPVRLKAVAVLDADYNAILPHASHAEQDGVLVLRLPCKELENLLLLDGRAVEAAAENVARLREIRTGERILRPTAQQIETKIDEFTQAADVRRPLECHWEFRWLKERGMAGPESLDEARKQFEKFWADPQWRRRCCGGKQVLKMLKHWIQEEFKLSFGSIERLFEGYEPDPELREMFDALDNYVLRASA
jgi:ABC-type transport system involved in cytochrome c biogenesis ATPase subunit